MHRSSIAICVITNGEREPHLVDTIASVLSQSRVPHERALLVDGLEHPLTDWIVIAGLVDHMSSARNELIRATKSQWIVYLESGWKIENVAVQTFMTHIEANEDAGCIRFGKIRAWKVKAIQDVGCWSPCDNLDKDMEERIQVLGYKIADARDVVSAIARGCDKPMKTHGELEPKIYHTWEHHEPLDDDERVRRKKAGKTWKRFHGKDVIPRPMVRYPRDSRVIGDKRCLPFLRDLIEFGSRGMRPQDILMVTNDDTCVHHSIVNKLKDALKTTGAVCAFRKDYNQSPDASHSVEDINRGGEWDGGRDLFAFTGRWLNEWMWIIPDFLLGAGGWDDCVARCIRRAGRMTDETVRNRVMSPFELPMGYIWHIRHEAKWKVGKMHKAMGYNLALIKQWKDLDIFELNDAELKIAMNELNKNAGKKSDQICFVQLGRYGDIMNALPMMKHVADNWGKPVVVTSKDFADIFKGVTYVDVDVQALEFGKVRAAQEYANGRYKHIIVSQVWGNDGHKIAPVMQSYNVDSWRIAGFIDLFGDPDLKLVFDKRNVERERMLSKNLGMENCNGSFILVNLSGNTAGMKHAEGIMDRIRRRWSRHANIVDLSVVRAEKIYDMLGLYDRAEVLITNDTSTLHLAGASEIKTIFLCNDNEWLATTPRFPVKLKIRHKDVLPRMGDIDRVISNEVMALPDRKKRVLGQVHHLVEYHAQDDPSGRLGLASKSWQACLEAKGVGSIVYSNYKRDARDIGDKRDLPYLKDMLEAGIDLSQPDDILMLTNDDIVVQAGCLEAVKLHVSLYGVGTAQRTDFQPGKMPPLDMPAEQVANLGERHMGRDLFFFTRRWLQQHYDEIPDFILGASEWDIWFIIYLRIMKGLPCTTDDLWNVRRPVDLPRGHITHQVHDAVWMQDVDESPSQIHNRRLLMEWAIPRTDFRLHWFFKGNWRHGIL